MLYCDAVYYVMILSGALCYDIMWCVIFATSVKVCAVLTRQAHGVITLLCYSLISLIIDCYSIIGSDVYLTSLQRLFFLFFGVNYYLIIF